MSAALAWRAANARRCAVTVGFAAILGASLLADIVTGPALLSPVTVLSTLVTGGGDPVTAA
ncbi:MAG: hypothetical protein J0H99_01170, partial [Rhodospirillales bacterium]|nr:hypothetical protein [Rhodospirillales bacterium]